MPWWRNMRFRDEAVAIQLDGEHLDGTLLVPTGLREPAPAVLFVHGWCGNQEQYLSRARTIAGLGCVCLTFDLPGHELTQPQHECVTREDSLQDARAAFHVRSRCRSVDALSVALVR